MDQQRLRELARKGLELEMRELEELVGEGKRRSGTTQAPRAKPKWSAAKRAEISARMKSYWSKRRAEAAAKPSKARAGKKGLPSG